MANLTAKQEIQLKEFHAANNDFEVGKMMHFLNKSKVPFTQLGKAIGCTDYVAKSYVKTYKKEAEANKVEKSQEIDTSKKIAQLEKSCEHNSVFSDALKSHISQRFTREVNGYPIQHEIRLIEVVGGFFRISVTVSTKDGTDSLSFVEYVNFDTDFKALVDVWAKVLDADFHIGTTG